MNKEKFRLIALDFETTGLDPLTDEPIQIGLLEFTIEGKIIGGFQSLLRPQKPMKELKSIVGFITGLSVEKLENAPSCETISKELAPFFEENTIIIGHNIAFDLEFLRRFFPKLKRKTSIDTFRLAQTLIHYAPSYALEILVDSLQSKASFHDAYFDAKLSIALFNYMVQRVALLSANYPALEELIMQSKSDFAMLLQKEKKGWLLPLEFPPLKKITPAHTQMLTGDFPFQRDEIRHGKKYQVKALGFKSVLSALATNKQTIFAFSNKSKLDIAKNLLNDLGIKNLGFVKEEQTLNPESLKKFINKGQFEESEFFFLLKYFSHAEQGLGVLDLNSKSDYEIYTALKDQRATVNYPVILATHGGLFSLLEQQERYADYDVVFFDVEWRYKSYNFYLSRPYDLNYTLNYLDMLSYKFRFECEVAQQGPAKEIQEKKLTLFEEFKQFFTMFLGILGQETKKFFTHTDMTVQTLEPIKDNVAFFQTNKLLPRFEEWKVQLENIVQAAELRSIWKQIEHMQTIFGGMMTVEKKMRGKSDFYFVYAEEVKFTNWEEFLEEFEGHKTLFLSNTDESLPALAEMPPEKAENQKKEDKIFYLSKSASVLKAIESFDREQFPNGVIFILSVKKEESRALFEEMIAKWQDQHFLLLVENITGGSGKNLFKAKQQGCKIIIGGYNFLLQLFAQKIAISQLIIYNSKWNQQDLIFSDIVRYGQEQLL